MNKFKLFYDVISKMKDKEVVCGTLMVNGQKDANKIFGLKNEFEKDMVNGQTKIKLVTEIDCEGTKVKHESNTELTMPGCHGHHHHCFLRHLHEHHQGAKLGMKERLNKLLFILDILKTIKIDEKEDQSVKLSLTLQEIPEDIIKSVHANMHNESVQICDQHNSLRKCFHDMGNPSVEINLLINKNREVEKIVFAASGEQKGEQGVHKMNIDAELNLTW